MGSVYAAVHASIERIVAIKVLHPELSREPQIATRFLNEARAVNMIRNENGCREVFVHVVDVESFSRLTGEPPPPTPISRASYEAAGFGWVTE